MVGKKAQEESKESWRGKSRFLTTRHDPFEQSFQAPQMLRAQDLAVWTTAIKGTKIANSPEHWPKPIVLSDLVIQSNCSPGRIVALDRQTGAIRWSLRLRYYGGNFIAAKDPQANLFYTGTCQELLAIDSATGKVVWSFCPYGRQGDSFYSAPALEGGRLFLGDRAGYLHCLDAVTGQIIWKILASRADRNQVNCDPVLLDGSVIFGTIGGLIVRADAATGRILWKQQFARQAAARPEAVADEKVLIRAGNSACLLSVVDRRVLWQWRRNNLEVSQACFAENLILLITQWCWGKDPRRMPFVQLRAFRDGVELYRGSYPRAIGPSIGYHRGTGLVYESTRMGLGIVDPRSGKRKAIIEFAPRYSMKGYHPHQPTVIDGKIYSVDEVGKVYALKHP